VTGGIHMGAEFGHRGVEDNFELEPPPRRSRPSPRIETRLESTDRVLIGGVALSVLALAGVGTHLWLQGFGFTADSLAARHVIAGTGCQAAKWVDLAPATRGQPGYYAALDQDGDGRSCTG